jgi:hypothetical protein
MCKHGAPYKKMPNLEAAPANGTSLGYDVNGLGFYHIPHAPINTSKTSNTSALVTVQGGVLSIPQLVAELSRLIPEKWQWKVTKHEKNSFIVPFPSRGDLLCSVAFEKAHIKEQNIDLLFEEWQPEEDGHPLPRVWIRIHRLPTKLREFSVLWALGSMLGVTQSVDMVTSLRKNYSRVEVAVLNVDLLPNLIDTVVIGDRLYSLPIQVEGREDNEEVETQMDVDDEGNDNANANGADKSTEPKEKSDRSNEANDQAEGSGYRNNLSSGTKKYSGSSKEQSAEPVNDHAIVDNKMYPAYTVQAGNSDLNFSKNTCVSCKSAQKQNVELISNADQQELQSPDKDEELHAYTRHIASPRNIEGKKDDEEGDLSGAIAQNDMNAAQVEHNSMTTLHGTVLHYNVSGAKNLASKFQDDPKGRKETVEGKVLAILWTTPVKRSKRREGSVDDDSSTRAQHLKAKKNLDAPGMSEAKSFLSFPNVKIKSTNSSLSISIGSNVDQGIDMIKEIEYKRLLEAPNLESANETQNKTDEDFESDIDSDFGSDHNAIQHLTGDLAENMFRIDGSPLMDFKPTPRHKKACSSRKKKAKKQIKK